MKHMSKVVFAAAVMAFAAGSAVADTKQQNTRMVDCNKKWTAEKEKSLKGTKYRDFMSECLSSKDETAPQANAAKPD